MILLSEIYDVTLKRQNRGAAKSGWVRPTIGEFFMTHRDFQEINKPTMSIRYDVNNSASFFTFSENDTKATATITRWTIARTAPEITTKSYFEVQHLDAWALMVGVITENHAVDGITHTYIGRKSASYDPGVEYGWSIDYGGRCFHNNETGDYIITGVPFDQGDVIGVAVDPPNGKIWFSVNGSWVLNGDPQNGSNPVYTNIPEKVYAAVSLWGSSSAKLQNPTYTVPNGFEVIS